MSWISVDAEKPSKYEDVLIFADGDIVFGTLCIEDNGDHYINNCWDGTLATHWQPLPEPPQDNTT